MRARASWIAAVVAGVAVSSGTAAPASGAPSSVAPASVAPAAGNGRASTATDASGSGAEPAATSGPGTVTPRPAARDPRRPTARRATLAQVVFPTAIHEQPGDAATSGRLETAATWGGGPVRLLVLRSAVGADGREWLDVRLPSRPNDRHGWIASDHVRLTTTAWRVVVSLRARTVEVRRAGRTVRRFRAVIGAPGTPTPRGLFAVSERIRQSSGNLGPWALHLTAHSDVLDDYGGGAGRVAIHGRSGALLGDPLGSARSHGCVRVDNAEISWLETRAVEGTPVEIR